MNTSTSAKRTILPALSLAEKIEWARVRVRNASALLSIHPDDKCYHAALDARLKELRALEKCLLTVDE